MCVLAFAWQAHPRWPLVLAGNRDELHARPALPLARWEHPGYILAGRDLQSGGTWLGVSERGRLAVVTNLRGHGAPLPDRPSRGALVTDLLAGEERHAAPGPAALADFNPFNLILVADGHARFVTNRPAVVRAELQPGLYGLSNGTLDEPWPKTLRLKSQLLEWIVGESDRPALLLDALRDETLPDAGIGPAAPSDVPQEPRRSPVFLRNPVYGTRCSTVVAIDDRGRGTILERRYAPDGRATGDTGLGFAWPGG